MKRITCLAAVVVLIGCSGPVERPTTSLKVRPLTRKQSAALIHGALKHIGEPYRYGGTSSAGWDCSGFASVMYHAYLSYDLPRNTESMFSRSVGVRRPQQKPGDLVFFNPEGGDPSHVGIYMGGDRFIHASTSGGVVVSSLNEEYYRESFVGFRRPLLSRHR